MQDKLVNCYMLIQKTVCGGGRTTFSRGLAQLVSRLPSNSSRLSLRLEFKSRCGRLCGKDKDFDRPSDVKVFLPTPLFVALMPHPRGLLWCVVCTEVGLQEASLWKKRNAIKEIVFQ